MKSILAAWFTFRSGKRRRLNVLSVERHLEHHLCRLYHSLNAKTYRHGAYHPFIVHDPKRRQIHCAAIIDRWVHQLVYSQLVGVFEPKFSDYSFSCRKGKGQHKGLIALNQQILKVSQNFIQPCYALKCDIYRFFKSIDHDILKTLLRRVIKDPDFLWLLDEIIDSHNGISTPQKGLPIGNVTSQVFANIYLHELDTYMKHTLREPYYLRYSDDFICLSTNRAHLESLVGIIRRFLDQHLRLTLHPQKIHLVKLNQGIDFLGYVQFKHHRLLRQTTQNRLIRKLVQTNWDYLNQTCSFMSLFQSTQSYKGLMSHANTFRLEQRLHTSIFTQLSR